MSKERIRITETDLCRLIKESIKDVLNEGCCKEQSQPVANKEKEYKELEKRVRYLRNHVFDEDEAFGKKCEDELKQIMPKYRKLRNELYPSTDNSAMSATKGW